MNTNRYKLLGYRIFSHLEHSDVPMVSNVKTDSMTDMANECFDLPFDGQCTFYPFLMPRLPEFKTLVITGRSGSGKSTLLNRFRTSDSVRQYNQNELVVKAFIHYGINYDDYVKRMTLVGLDHESVLSKKYCNLSEGEKFRADISLQLDNNMAFDEFTSMVDRNVAKIVCDGMRDYIGENNLSGIVMCSCHKDFVGWIQPDFIIDLDDSTVYAKGEEECLHEYVMEEELIGSFSI